MTTFQQAAARDTDSADLAYAKLAANIAERAADHDLVVVGPLLSDDSGWSRVFVFAAADTVIGTLGVNLGPTRPPRAGRSLLKKYLRRRFARAAFCETAETMALVVTTAWPSPRADEFVANLFSGGPAIIHDFSDQGA